MNEEVTDLTTVGAGAVDGMVDLQISTARKYPRDMDLFVESVRTMALRDEETAANCMYALPRAGKVIEGPSVRFAEIIVTAWKNVRADVQSAPVGPQDKDVTSVATFFDLETNVAIRVSTKRSIVGKNGRYNADMIAMTQNANNSVAFRNAVFKGVPAALWEPTYLAAREKAIGEGGTIPEKRQQLIQWLGARGIDEAQVLKRLEVKAVDDIYVDELVKLKGLINATKEGETTLEEVFAGASAAPDAPGDLKDRLAKQKEGKTGKSTDGDIAKKAAARKAEHDAEAAEQGSATPEHPEPAPAPPVAEDEGLISRQKITAIKAAAAKANVSDGELMDHLSISLEVADLESLTPASADAVMDWLEAQEELPFK